MDYNPDLSDVEKLNYLSKLLDSTAKVGISGFSLTEANYTEALSIKRFGGTQQSISTLEYSVADGLSCDHYSS